VQLVFRSYIKGYYPYPYLYDFCHKHPQCPLHTGLIQCFLTLFHVWPSFRTVSMIGLLPQTSTVPSSYWSHPMFFNFFHVWPSFRAVSMIVLFKVLLWLFSTSAMKGPVHYVLYCLLCLFPYHMSNPFHFFPFFFFLSVATLISFCHVLLQSPWLKIISHHFVFIMLLKQSFTDAYNLFSMFHSSFKGW